MEREASPGARPLGVFRTVGRNRDLLRLETAFAGFSMAEWATWIAIIVFAYQRGGATEAGLVAVIQLVPSALAAPFVASLGDRYRRDRYLTWGYAAQVVAMAAAGSAILSGAPVAVVYVLAAFAATSVTVTRPGQGALLPALASSPEELTAANAVTGTIEGLAFFAGPAVAGVLLGPWGPGAVFVSMAGVLVVSALLANAIRTAAAPGPPAGGDRHPAREAFGGFGSLAGDRASRLVVGLTAGQSLVVGALDVLTVALAISVLDLGRSGAGFLTSALGAGGIMGSVAALALVGRRRLSPALGAGALFLGLPVAVIGLSPERAVAVAMLIVAGAGRTLLDVAGRTLLQRIVPDEVLARVFGVLEGLYMAALAAGSLAASAFVAAFGPRGALIAVGAMLPALVLASWPRLMRVEEAAPAPPAEYLELLRAVPAFAQLSAPTLERLAANLVPEDVPSGAVILRQGAPADRFYVVRQGEVEVDVDGRTVEAGTRGYSFGEIALLRSVPRTASVRARSPVRLLALEREPFLAAVTGNARARASADRTVSLRLPDRSS